MPVLPGQGPAASFLRQPVRPPPPTTLPRLAATLLGAAALAWAPLALGQQPPPDAPADPPAQPPADRGDVSTPRGSSGTITTPPAPAPAPGKATPPRLVKYVDPVYPPDAQQKGLEAAVALQLDIDAAGKVAGATVVDPAGNGFDEAAIAAAKQLEFEPARRANGQAAPARILYRFTFTLKPAAPPPGVGPGAGPDGGSPPPAPTEPFSGVVLSDEGEVALVGATVTLVTKDGPLVATASANGSFSFGALPAGKYRVSVRAPGYDPLDVEEEIAEGEEIVVRYRLVTTGDGLEVVIRGERPPREVTKRTITKREIDRIPGTNGDALRSIQNLPGVARPPGIAGILLVRGSGPAETQTFIDGTPVPLIYHFGGLSSVVPTEVLNKIDFYPGNFGAEYGRVQGGIVDVGLRSPKDDGYHGLVQVDLIDARLLLEGPIPFIGDDGWTFMAAGRRSYIDAWLGPVLEAAGAGVTQAPVYYDYQFLVEHNDAETGRFRLGFFGSDDSLELLVNEPAPGEPALSGNIGLATRFQRLQLLYENEIGDDDRIRAVLAAGQDDIEFSLGPLYFLLNVKSINGRFEHARRVSKGVTFNSGVDFFAGNATVDLRIPEPNRPGEPPNQPFSTRPFRELSSEIAYMFPAIYEEVELSPIPRWRIVPGVRLDGYTFNGGFDIQPRASSRFDIFTGFPRTTLKGGAGVYSQPPQFQQVVEEAGGNPDLDSNRAIHYSVGLEQELTRQIELSGEAFFKQLDRQVRASVSDDGGSTSYDNRGIGYVVGGEFLAKYKPDDRFFGWIADTISRSARQNGPGEDEFLVSFDQTHILTMLGSYKLGHGWEFGARFRLVSGNLVDPSVCNPSEEGCDPNRVNGLLFGSTGTYIPIPLGNNTERLPPFHALDLRVDKRWQFQSWQLSAYLDVQNVYNNQNIEGIQYNFNYTARQNVSGIPILPSIGLRADFLIMATQLPASGVEPREPGREDVRRPRTSRLRRAVLVTLAAATTAVVITPSCGGSFDPPSLVNAVRVITVEADSPYANPGETIRLKMRYQDGRQDIEDPAPLQITWLGGCFNPPGDQYYGCYEPLGELVARVQAGDVSPTEFLLQGPNFDEFVVTLPDDILSSRSDPAFGTKVGTGFVFFAVCAGELRPVQDAGDTDAASFPFGCFDETGKRLGADEFVPGYTVVYAYEDGRRNANPTVNGFLLDGEALEDLANPSVELCSVTEEDRAKTDCNAIDEFEECKTYEIDVDVPRDVAETDPDSNGVDGEPLDEVVWVNYYAEAGDFDGAIKLINDADQGYQGDHGTVWVPPPEKGRYAIWAVVHDSRGGTTTLQRFVTVE